MGLNEMVKNCGKCALCLSICPVYKAQRNEIVSPRGKVQLIKAYLKGELKISKYFENIFFTCLFCEGCKSICPGGLKLDELFLKMRNEFVKKYGMSLSKKLLFKIFSNKNRLSAVSNLARLSNKKIPFINFKIGVLNTKNIFRFSSRTLKSQFPELVKSKVEKKGTVLFFTGCMDNFFYDEVGNATINILTKLGYDVILSKEEMCCGIPMLVSGDFEGSLINIKNNLELLSMDNIDYIIVTCATCGTALKSIYLNVLSELNLEKEFDIAKKISNKVKDINEFLVDKIDLRLRLSSVERQVKSRNFQNKKITYHDPCHLIYGQNIKEEPRIILKNIQGLEYVEMAEVNCCGGAGLFHVNFPDISKKIGKEKLNNIINTKADIIATSCPSCKIQLINLIKNAKLNIKVLHTVELIYKK